MEFMEKVIDFFGPWSWWVLGILLAAVEVFFPGAFFIWFAVAAMIVGTLALSVTMTWQVQLIVFAVIAVVSAILGRRFYGRASRVGGNEKMNDRLSGMVGRSAVLDTALSGGSGHIRIDDTLWRVNGPDLPAGAAVVISGVDNGRLVVRAG